VLLALWDPEAGSQKRAKKVCLVQVNIRAGKFPPRQANGVHYLVIPVTFKASKG
jgi:hypothetical protein